MVPFELWFFINHRWTLNNPNLYHPRITSFENHEKKPTAMPRVLTFSSYSPQRLVRIVSIYFLFVPAAIQAWNASLVRDRSTQGFFPALSASKKCPGLRAAWISWNTLLKNAALRQRDAPRVCLFEHRSAADASIPWCAPPFLLLSHSTNKRNVWKRAACWNS